jgi:hypothetical protein
MSKKSRAINKPKPVPTEVTPLTTEEYLREAIKEALLLGHLVKYNLYLLSKAVLFSSIYGKNSSAAPEVSVEIVNRLIDELDLDTKARKQLAEQSKNAK